jgi:acyl-CoA thioester hydrolase
MAAPRARVDVPPDNRDLQGDFPHHREIEVRFGDSDAMGHANNAIYLTYCEIARLEYWEAATGRPFPLPLHGEEHSQILAEIRVTFRSPAMPREILTIETRASHIGRSSYTLQHRMTAQASERGEARLVAVADAVQVGYDYGTSRPYAIPDADVAALEAFEGRRLRD